MTPIGEARFQRLRARARPFDADELRRLSPMLILAPHQDDETLGCGGLIATACALGLRPRLAYLTDGGASHAGSPTWPRDRRVAARRREALAAAAVLGVAGEDVLFLDWPDARPHPLASPAFDRTVEQLRAWTPPAPPTSVWAPWSEEKHCDHLAASQVAAAFRRALDPQPAGYAFLVWGWTEPALDAAPNPRALLCEDTISARRRALACHLTQTTGLIPDASRAFAVPDDLAAVTDRPAEIFLELP